MPVPFRVQVLNQIAQLGRNVFVDRELSSVDDAHGQTGTNRVVQEDRVDGFAQGIVAAEAE